MKEFPVAYQQILDRVEGIDPETYTRTRNFLTGAVSRLSPYISRGVISPRQILLRFKSKGYSWHQCEKFIQELAWREYFQRVLQQRPELIGNEIKNPQENVRSEQIPSALVHAATGIEAIDGGIRGLYDSGYMHNHLRMYVASLACNLARCSWKQASRWMYYHLLDADPASNFCSWQWICGAFSSKKYYANQENINRYCGTDQQGTFLDKSYEEIELMDCPTVLEDTMMPAWTAEWPLSSDISLDPSRPVLIYNFFNLDPQWHAGENCHRILLLEPSLFSALPVSSRVIDFVLQLSSGIENISIYTGEFAALQKTYPDASFIYREHPLNGHYRGRCEERDWMFPEVTGYFPSFSAYWKKCFPYLKAHFA